MGSAGTDESGGVGCMGESSARGGGDGVLPVSVAALLSARRNVPLADVASGSGTGGAGAATNQSQSAPCSSAASATATAT